MSSWLDFLLQTTGMALHGRQHLPLVWHVVGAADLL